MNIPNARDRKQSNKQEDFMRTYLRLLLISVPLIACVGCATPTVTHIKSVPPGARIEMNEGVLGSAPIDVTLPQHGEYHQLRGKVVLKAYPTKEGEYRQEKVLFYQQEAPAKVQFIMTQPPPQKP
jgi:hypothetical protein